MLTLNSTARAAELVWSAPDGCSSDAFVLELEAAAEQRVEAIVIPKIVVVIEHGRSSSTPWQVELSFDQGSRNAAKRTLSGESCHDVSRAAAVAVATALHDAAIPRDTSHSLSVPPTASAPPVAPPVPSVPGAITRDGDEVAPAASALERRWRVPLHGFAGIDSALQGVPSLGFGLGVGVGVGRWQLALSGTHLPTVTLGEGVAIALQTTLAAGGACFEASKAPVRPRFCLAYEIGRIIGSGRGGGLSVKRQQTAIWQAFAPELGLVVDLDDQFFFQFSLVGAVALSDAVFVFDEGRVAHDLPNFTVRGNVGLGWQL